MWLAVDTQWRTTAFSIVGLDLSTVMQMADVFDVSVDKALIQKMKMLERYELKRAAKREGDGSGK